jgi:adenine-specific DNA-methyltransferase
MTVNRIIHGDCLKVLPDLPKARMIWADPPDNLGMKYDGYKDDLRPGIYAAWLGQVVRDALFKEPDVFWLSFYYRHLFGVCGCTRHDGYEARLFLWRFTFGQHRDTDCGNGFRPILRFARAGTTWDTDAIRIESKRQRNGDARANPKGRVPDDVWDFSRVCGTFSERRTWHPTQHPETLVERMILMSTKPGDLVIDLFAGSGTTNRVCPRMGRDCIAIDISGVYCHKIAEETGAELIAHASAPHGGLFE